MDFRAGNPPPVPAREFLLSLHMTPRPPIPRSGVDAGLEREWQAVLDAFQAYRSVPPEQRFHHLGRLFEKVAPWLERGIQAAVLHHFVLLPKEMAVARLFAKTTRRDSLPDSYAIFLIWVESNILRDVADPRDELGAVNGASGEPSGELQKRFNRMPFDDRALLYLFMVERCNLEEVNTNTGIPVAHAQEQLARIAKRFSDLDLPRGWRRPD